MTSVTELGDFWKGLAKTFLIKIASILKRKKSVVQKLLVQFLQKLDYFSSGQAVNQCDQIWRNFAT